MKKIYTTVILSLSFLFSLSSCSDFLDIAPRDKFLETQVFTNERNIQSAITGIYVGLAEESLYGGNLTMSTIDVLAQRYNVGNFNHVWVDYAEFKYGNENVQTTFDNIWTEAYDLVLNLNILIERLNKTSGIIEPAEKDILLGEAHALRAMLQFDMLRLYGPVFPNNPDASSIPYYTEPKAGSNEFLSANKIIERVLADLDSAEQLLAEDAIIKNGIDPYDDDQGTGNFYEDGRQLRMNYYAVKGLRARVQLYAGNEEEALVAAQSVIDAHNDEKRFPWAGRSGDDPLFASEVMFGLYNPTRSDRHDEYFRGLLRDSQILAPFPDQLKAVYESNENDYRYNAWWKIPTESPPRTSVDRNYRIFFKFDEQSGHLQPLIRLSEMYYIAAETEPNRSRALDYLNTVRFNRGLQNLDSSADLEAEIEKEYKKEFYGEGQTFFFYKRKAISTIPYALSSYVPSQSVGKDEYVVPLPNSETKFRN